MDYDTADAIDMANDERSNLSDKVDGLTRENEALKRSLALEVAGHAVTRADLKCWIAAEAFAQGAWDKDNPDHDDVRLDAELASAKAALAALVNP